MTRRLGKQEKCVWFARFCYFSEEPPGIREFMHNGEGEPLQDGGKRDRTQDTVSCDKSGAARFLLDERFIFLHGYFCPA